jgi:hypothetical protein
VEGVVVALSARVVLRTRRKDRRVLVQALPWKRALMTSGKQESWTLPKAEHRFSK